MTVVDGPVGPPRRRVAHAAGSVLLVRRWIDKLLSLVDRAREAILQSAVLVVMVCVAVSLVAGYGVRWLSFDPDSRLFFSTDDPERIALEELEGRFSKVNNIIFILTPAGGDVLTPNTLRAVAWLTERAVQTPYSQKVYSITNEPFSYAEGDDVVIEDLVPSTATLSSAELELTRRRIAERPDLTNQMISAKGDVTAVMVTVNAPRTSRDEVPSMAKFAHALAVEFGARYPDIEVRLSGGIMADQAFAEAGRRDLVSLVPLMSALVVTTLWVGLRSVTGTLAMFLTIGIAVVTTMGLVGWSGMVLNPATAAAPVVIMVLTLAGCAHIVATANRAAADGKDRRAAVGTSLEENGFAVSVNSLTTLIGFMALGFSIAPPIQELGNIVSVGTLVAFTFSFTFLPALLVLLPMSNRPEAGVPVLRNWLRRLASFVIGRQQLVLAIAATVLVGLGLGMTRITFDDDFIRYFDQSYRFRADTDFLQRRLSGLHVVQFAVPAGEEGGVTRPDYLAKVDEFASWLGSRPKVVHVSTITDLFKRLNKSMNGDDPSFFKVPDSRELAAQYLLFYEMSLPQGHDLGSRLDIGRSQSKVTAHLANVSAREIQEIAAAGEAWLRDNAPSMAAPASGLSLMYAYVSERNVRGMLLGTALGLVLISLVLVAVLRSVRLGLLSLIPNFFPALMAFGLWGYLFGEVNLAASVVMVTTFGIVVDDTVHFLTRYVDGRRRQGLSNEDAIRYCYDVSGVPCLLTSVALCLGFSVLAYSGFAITSQMGLLSAMTIGIAWFGDYFCLPALLVRLSPKI